MPPLQTKKNGQHIHQPHGGRKTAPNAARLLAVQTTRHVSPVLSHAPSGLPLGG